MDVRTIGMIGAGPIGREIAYAAALGGYRTVLEDVSPDMLERAWPTSAGHLRTESRVVR